ncbi:hypothetical protein BT96DRAFT_929974 [Gymnopus androsaceus JB14]|uniref:Ricin B lectin domain-containing protein n=1 Tax=Gymnopus androsaceus JB14 TaxID=1447944 RepID=A0A6A4GCC1_9AGAR|nr:hypothetical protein BT96DRAFT_929974 [Gymnopus androsaceus JB14]
MSIIQSGRYTICNVKQSNFASLQDPNDGTPVTADSNDFNNTNKWNVIRLGNGKYNFQNVASGSYANTGSRPPVGTTVEGRPSPVQFVIQETRVKNQFTISTTDSRLYWGLVDDEHQTSVELSDRATDQRNWWVFRSTQ